MHYAEAKSLLTQRGEMNLYRGCTHGCIYCDSRSTCYRFTHPFEDVEVKINAPELLERVLRSRRRRCVVGSGSMADPYQPCERELALTRRCLELLDRYGFGASVITKSDMVLRDADLWQRIHRKARAVVQMTLTCADDDLSRKLEPHVCTSRRRFEVLKELQRLGVPTVVWMTPFLPHITDTRENLCALLDWCMDAGVRGIVFYGVGMTLRDGSREHYYRALDRLFPGLSDAYRTEYGNAYAVMSPQNDRLSRLFHETCQARGILHAPEDCFRYITDMPEAYVQTSLFDE